MRILVGLSGGVDSAVAAYLLQQQGHDIVAGFMLNYLDENNPNCTTKKDIESFHQVREHLGIRYFEIFDFRDQYEEKVLNYIYDGYLSGITPNPDVLCNTEVKFKLFLQEGISGGYDAIATGHYAINDNGHLLRAVDHNKDQTYFLAGLDQFQLSKSLFPIGGYTKPQVRQIAQEIGLPNANRPDSQGLCFVGKVSMKDFLGQKIGPKPGVIKKLDGSIVGSHTGAYQYTVGQRRGLFLPFQAYVCDIDILSNTVFVTDQEDDPALYSTGVWVKNRHWIGSSCQPGAIGHGKIRYRQELFWMTLVSDTEIQEGDTIYVQFNQHIKGVASGQVLAFYQGDELIGSGIMIREKIING